MLLDGAKFICLNKNREPIQTIVAKGRHFTIGCLLDCDCILEKAEEKIICQIESDAFGHVTIYNKSAKNPVSVNGETVTIKRTLFNNSIIKILENEYLWKHPKTSVNVDGSTENTAGPSTPKLGIPLQQPNSCPSLKYHRNLTNRFTVHNLRTYRVDTNDYSCTDEINENQTASVETEENANIASTSVLLDVTPAKVDLVDSTPDKKTSSTEKRLKTFRNVWGWSGMTTTSYSPRETGIRIEKTFSAIIPPTTPNSSICRTPKGLLERLGVEKSNNLSTDLLTFATPTKNVDNNAGVVVQHTKSAMKIIDLTTPSKLRPESPFRKIVSDKKLNAVKSFTSCSKKGMQSADAANITPLCNTPKSIDNAETPVSTSSAITVDSSSTASDVSEVSVVTSTTSSRTKMTHTTTPCSILRKQALMASAKKQEQNRGTPGSRILPASNSSHTAISSGSKSNTPVSTKIKSTNLTSEKKSVSHLIPGNSKSAMKNLPTIRQLNTSKAEKSNNLTIKLTDAKVGLEPTKIVNVLTTSTPYKVVNVVSDKPDSTQLHDTTEFFSALHSSSEESAESDKECTGEGDELMKQIEEILHTSDELKKQLQAAETNDEESEIEGILQPTISPPPASIELIEPITPPATTSKNANEIKLSPKSSVSASVILKAINTAEKQKAVRSLKEDDEKENKINESAVTPIVTARRRISLSGTPITSTANATTTSLAVDETNNSIINTPLTPKRVTKRRPSIDEIPFGNTVHSRTIDQFNTENMGAIVEEESGNETISTSQSAEKTAITQLNKDYITLNASEALTISVTVNESKAAEAQAVQTLDDEVVMSPLQCFDESFGEICNTENESSINNEDGKHKNPEHLKTLPEEITKDKKQFSQSMLSNSIKIQPSNAVEETTIEIDESFGEVEYLEDSNLTKEIENESKNPNETFEIQTSNLANENENNDELPTQENYNEGAKQSTELHEFVDVVDKEMSVSKSIPMINTSNVCEIITIEAVELSKTKLDQSSNLSLLEKSKNNESFNIKIDTNNAKNLLEKPKNIELINPVMDNIQFNMDVEIESKQITQLTDSSPTMGHKSFHDSNDISNVEKEEITNTTEGNVSFPETMDVTEIIADDRKIVPAARNSVIEIKNDKESLITQVKPYEENEPSSKTIDVTKLVAEEKLPSNEAKKTIVQNKKITSKWETPQNVENAPFLESIKVTPIITEQSICGQEVMELNETESETLSTNEHMSSEGKICEEVSKKETEVLIERQNVSDDEHISIIKEKIIEKHALPQSSVAQNDILENVTQIKEIEFDNKDQQKADEIVENIRELELLEQGSLINPAGELKTSSDELTSDIQAVKNITKANRTEINNLENQSSFGIIAKENDEILEISPDNDNTCEDKTLVGESTNAQDLLEIAKETLNDDKEDVGVAGKSLHFAKRLWSSEKLIESHETNEDLTENDEDTDDLDKTSNLIKSPEVEASEIVELVAVTTKCEIINKSFKAEKLDLQVALEKKTKLNEVERTAQNERSDKINVEEKKVEELQHATTKTCGTEEHVISEGLSSIIGSSEKFEEQNEIEVLQLHVELEENAEINEKQKISQNDSINVEEKKISDKIKQTVIIEESCTVAESLSKFEAQNESECAEFSEPNPIDEASQLLKSPENAVVISDKENDDLNENFVDAEGFEIPEPTAETEKCENIAKPFGAKKIDVESFVTNIIEKDNSFVLKQETETIDKLNVEEKKMEESKLVTIEFCDNEEQSAIIGESSSITESLKKCEAQNEAKTVKISETNSNDDINETSNLMKSPENVVVKSVEDYDDPNKNVVDSKVIGFPESTAMIENIEKYSEPNLTKKLTMHLKTNENSEIGNLESSIKEEDTGETNLFRESANSILQENTENTSETTKNHLNEKEIIDIQSIQDVEKSELHQQIVSPKTIELAEGIESNIFQEKSSADIHLLTEVDHTNVESPEDSETSSEVCKKDRQLFTELKISEQSISKEVHVINSVEEETIQGSKTPDNSCILDTKFSTEITATDNTFLKDSQEKKPAEEGPTVLTQLEKIEESNMIDIQPSNEIKATDKAFVKEAEETCEIKNDVAEKNKESKKPEKSSEIDITEELAITEQPLSEESKTLSSKETVLNAIEDQKKSTDEQKSSQLQINTEVGESFANEIITIEEKSDCADETQSNELQLDKSLVKETAGSETLKGLCEIDSQIVKPAVEEIKKGIEAIIEDEKETDQSLVRETNSSKDTKENPHQISEQMPDEIDEKKTFEANKARVSKEGAQQHDLKDIKDPTSFENVKIEAQKPENINIHNSRLEKADSKNEATGLNESVEELSSLVENELNKTELKMPEKIETDNIKNKSLSYTETIKESKKNEEKPIALHVENEKEVAEKEPEKLRNQRGGLRRRAAIAPKYDETSDTEFDGRKQARRRRSGGSQKNSPKKQTLEVKQTGDDVKDSSLVKTPVKRSRKKKLDLNDEKVIPTEREEPEKLTIPKKRGRKNSVQDVAKNIEEPKVQLEKKTTMLEENELAATVEVDKQPTTRKRGSKREHNAAIEHNAELAALEANQIKPKRARGRAAIEKIDEETDIGNQTEEPISTQEIKILKRTTARKGRTQEVQSAGTHHTKMEHEGEVMETQLEEEITKRKTTARKPRSGKKNMQTNEFDLASLPQDPATNLKCNEAEIIEKIQPATVAMPMKRSRRLNSQIERGAEPTVSPNEQGQVEQAEVSSHNVTIEKTTRAKRGKPSEVAVIDDTKKKLSLTIDENSEETKKSRVTGRRAKKIENLDEEKSKTETLSAADNKKQTKVQGRKKQTDEPTIPKVINNLEETNKDNIEDVKAEVIKKSRARGTGGRRGKKQEILIVDAEKSNQQTAETKNDVESHASGSTEAVAPTITSRRGGKKVNVESGTVHPEDENSNEAPDTNKKTRGRRIASGAVIKKELETPYEEANISKVETEQKKATLTRSRRAQKQEPLDKIEENVDDTESIATNSKLTTQRSKHVHFDEASNSITTIEVMKTMANAAVEPTEAPKRRRRR